MNCELNFLCNSEFGAARAGVALHFLIAGGDNLVVDEFPRGVDLSIEVFVNFAFHVAAAHEVLH